MKQGSQEKAGVLGESKEVLSRGGFVNPKNKIASYFTSKTGFRRDIRGSALGAGHNNGLRQVGREGEGPLDEGVGGNWEGSFAGGDEGLAAGSGQCVAAGGDGQRSSFPLKVGEEIPM